MFLPCSRIAFKNTMLHVVALFPNRESSGLWKFLSFFFPWKKIWGILFKFFYRITWSFWCFLKGRQGLWVLRKTITEMKYPFHHTMSRYMLPTWLITNGVNFHLTKIVFPSFLHRKATFLSFPFSLEASHQVLATLKESWG